MSWCARAAPALLPHVNFLLAVCDTSIYETDISILKCLYAGAGLATAARLKWDPSTYIALRELFPAEYRVMTAIITVLSVLHFLLGHLALVALGSSRPSRRRALLYTYAATMAAVIVCEVAFVSWLVVQVIAWLDSEQAQMLEESMELRHHIEPILQFFGKWHPLPAKVKNIVKEAEEDLPRNGYAGAVAFAILLVLQPLSLALALIAAAAQSISPFSQHSLTRGSTISSSSAEERPLKATYRNGRLRLV